jgi:hypothetical protein
MQPNRARSTRTPSAPTVVRIAWVSSVHPVGWLICVPGSGRVRLLSDDAAVGSIRRTKIRHVQEPGTFPDVWDMPEIL